MQNTSLYCLPEESKKNNYVLASYYIHLPSRTDIVKKAEAMAVGQTIGTWVPVPGITEKMRNQNMGKVVRILSIPPAELSTDEKEELDYIIQIAYPEINFHDSLPMLLTTLLGNDASTSAQVKLVDLQLPERFLDCFSGPKFGIEGLRKLTGIEKRPFILNMIKPCIGFTPEIGAKIFYETALGGVDFIKDDELLGDPEFCPAVERVKEYSKAAKAAYEKTGKKTIYVVNATAKASRQKEHIEALLEAGAEAIMINFAAVGYSMFHYLTESCPVPVLGHYATSGMLFEGNSSGLSSEIAAGKLPRLCGADIVMMNTPYGGYPLRKVKYIQLAKQLALPWGKIKPTLPSVGGGVHPGIVETYMRELGNDIMLAPGGAVQGHPMGAAAGVKAMLQAIDYVLKGETVQQAMEEHEELRAAIEQFGYRGEKAE